MAASTVGDEGLTIEAREAVAAAFRVLRQYLAGTLEVAGATVKGDGHLAIVVATDGESLSIKVSGHRPQITKSFGLVEFRGTLQEIVVMDDEATLVIDGLPDVKIRVK